MFWMQIGITMSEKLLLQHIQNLSGGLNLRADDSLLQANEGTEVLNFQFNTDGSLTKRSGSTKYNPTSIAPSRVHSLYRFYKSTTGFKEMLCIVSSTLYKGNDGLGTWTSVGSVGSSDPATFSTWKEKVYIANGSSNVWSYSGSTLLPVPASPPVKYIVFRKDRLYGAGSPSEPNRLYFTDTGDPSIWNTSSNYIDIRENDGDVITGILPLQDYLVIYKRNSIWLLSGTANSSFFLTQVSSSIGCNASKSLVAYENVHYFLDNTGVYQFNSSQLLNISEKVQPEIDSIPKNSFANAVGVIYKRQYLLSYTKEGENYNNTILILDLRLLAWALWSNLNISSFTLWDGGDDELEIFAGDSSAGFVWQLDSGDDDDGSDIAVRFVSKYSDLDGNPLGHKQARYVHIVTSLAAVSPTLILSIDWGSESQSVQFDINNNISLWDSGSWDQGLWVGAGVNKTQRPLVTSDKQSVRGQAFSLTIQETSSKNWKLLGYGIAFKQEPSEYIILGG